MNYLLSTHILSNSFPSHLSWKPLPTALQLSKMSRNVPKNVQYYSVVVTGHCSPISSSTISVYFSLVLITAANHVRVNSPPTKRWTQFISLPRSSLILFSVATVIMVNPQRKRQYGVASSSSRLVYQYVTVAHTNS